MTRLQYCHCSWRARSVQSVWGPPSIHVCIHEFSEPSCMCRLGAPSGALRSFIMAAIIYSGTPYRVHKGKNFPIHSSTAGLILYINPISFMHQILDMHIHSCNTSIKAIPPVPAPIESNNAPELRSMIIIYLYILIDLQWVTLSVSTCLSVSVTAALMLLHCQCRAEKADHTTCECRYSIDRSTLRCQWSDVSTVQSSSDSLVKSNDCCRRGLEIDHIIRVLRSRSFMQMPFRAA